MDAVIVMGAVNLLLCGWVLLLQHRLKVARITVGVSTEIIRQLAIGELEIDHAEGKITIKGKA